MTHFIDTFPTPVGVFSTAVDSNGALIATAFGGFEALRRRCLLDSPITDSSAGQIAREQVLAYFAGERREFTLSLSPRGTVFQMKVWSALQRIPFGETRTYGQIAAELGIPVAARAVGRANATNPICLIVPCHRVLGTDGSLTGFAFGHDIKRHLLEHEAAIALRSRAA
jgi:methylated-DNA-[protein]-cysteine S-methyltransferase